MRSCCHQSAFSLVELLTVMAIISVIAGLTVSSLNFSGAENLRSAGNAVSDTVALARQNSISQDVFTAIVVQTGGANAYSTYCLMQLKRDSVTGSFTGSSWQPLTAWRHLGNGLIFDPAPPASAGKTSFFPASGPLMGAINPNSSLSYQGQAIDLTNPAVAVFQVFRPDGTMAEQQTLRLRVVRGTWNSASTSISYQGALSGGVPSNYYDILFLQHTGQTKIVLP